MQKTYSETFVVSSTECDLYKRWRLDALFLNMQGIGEQHANRLGVGYKAMFDRGLFFALTRIHIQVFSPPVAGQTITHTTWPGQSNRFFCPRYHEFLAQDGTLLAAAHALWVVLDLEKRTVVSPIEVLHDFPDNSDLTPPTSKPGRPIIKGDMQHFTRTPVYSEYDMNGHVNNTKYIAWMCDAIGKGTLKDAYISDLLVGYEKEIRDELPLDLGLSLIDNDFSFCVSSDAGKHFVACGTLSRRSAQ